MANVAMERAAAQQPAEIAGQLVHARLRAQSLPGFPGVQPTDLQTAYACQEQAIGLWPDEIVGWKIGRLASDQEKRFGQMRLSGPIFNKALRHASKDVSVAFPVFAGGFAAVESEFVLRLDRDAPADKTTWTTAEATDIVGAMHIAIETAGSPMAAINDLGSTAVISDFGNNAGLILGPEISDWKSRELDTLTVTTSINGVVAGHGTAAGIPGGPVEALRFLLEHTAQRGRPLKKGMLISTGAITGIHDVVAGQTGLADFGNDGRIACHAVRATPQP
ncbi:MAG: 2-keto-4-pentenoate hydratase [Rhodospirillaceae bacterium]|nr:2-keto-4-pentenoate hydratase [Rhodospirillaceae bacterium]